MTKLPTLCALLATTALLAPATAFAQDAGSPPSSPSASDVGDDDDQAAEQEVLETVQPGADDTPPEVEISSPGADRDDEIIIRGTYIPSPVRATPEVVSVLSAEDIARTGDGDIAGALERVTGLSVVGGRFVYVRGLGERYSSALLNGAPLPSPEPLRRVVPLDLFPTSIVSSTMLVCVGGAVRAKQRPAASVSISPKDTTIGAATVSGVAAGRGVQAARARARTAKRCIGPPVGSVIRGMAPASNRNFHGPAVRRICDWNGPHPSLRHSPT